VLGANRCAYLDEIYPCAQDLWVVDHRIKTTLRRFAEPAQGVVVCFTPGTMIMTPDGVRDVANLSKGDFAQTADYGRAEVLWLGSGRVTGAWLKAEPSLTPVRLRAGA
jgi:hypothetical protein